jgi:hypothetical protein
MCSAAIHRRAAQLAELRQRATAPPMITAIPMDVGRTSPRPSSSPMPPRIHSACAVACKWRQATTVHLQFGIASSPISIRPPDAGGVSCASPAVAEPTEIRDRGDHRDGYRCPESWPYLASGCVSKLRAQRRFDVVDLTAQPDDDAHGGTSGRDGRGHGSGCGELFEGGYRYLHGRQRL